MLTSLRPTWRGECTTIVVLRSQGPVVPRKVHNFFSTSRNAWGTAFARSNLNIHLYKRYVGRWHSGKRFLLSKRYFKVHRPILFIIYLVSFRKKERNIVAFIICTRHKVAHKNCKLSNVLPNLCRFRVGEESRKLHLTNWIGGSYRLLASVMIGAWLRGTRKEPDVTRASQDRTSWNWKGIFPDRSDKVVTPARWIL